MTLNRLSPVTSEQLLPGAMSPTKPHQFILAYKCKNPLLLETWTNFSFLLRDFYGEQWTTLVPLTLSVAWDVKTMSLHLSSLS